MAVSVPAVQHEDTVRPEWIDNNDHMNLAYYVLVFTAATGALGRQLGLRGRLRTAQMHTVYEREVTLGDRLRIATYLLGADKTRLHLFQEMFQMKDGYRAATLETIADCDAPFEAAVRKKIAARIAREPLAGAGRQIAMPLVSG